MVTEYEALQVIDSANKEYQRVGSKYYAGRITKQELDLMRGILNGMVRYCRAKIREDKERQKEKMQDMTSIQGD